MGIADNESDHALEIDTEGSMIMFTMTNGTLKGFYPEVENTLTSEKKQQEQ